MLRLRTKHLLFIITALLIGGILWTSFSDLRKKSGYRTQSEPYTELYFEDHLHLPRKLVPGQPLEFRYTVVNHQNKQMRYPVEIYLQDESDPPLVLSLANSELSLKPEETTTQQFSIQLPKMLKQKNQIIVKLADQDQSIHFWVNVASFSATPSSTIILTK